MRDRPRMFGVTTALVAGSMAAILAVTVGAPARAGGITAEQLISIAESQLGMTCAPVNPSLEHCQTSPTSPDQWSADIEPASGPVTALTTTATQFVAPLDQRGIGMMDVLQVPTCVDRVGVEAFIAKVGAMVGNGSIGPQAVAACSMTGVLQAAPRSYVYTVRSTVLPPATPTPTASPVATASPTASPAVGAQPSVVPSAPSVTPTPSSTNTATPSPTASPSTTASASASPTPEQEVAGIVGSPPPAVGGKRAKALPGLGFASSVATPDLVRFDAGTVGASALLALLLLLVMAFPGEVFNSTVESNYDEIAGWLRWLRLPGLGGVWSGPAGVILLLALGALVYSLLDPGFGTDSASVASYVGLLAGLVVVLAAFELPGLLMHRRRTGELGSLRALPWTLVAGAVCVVVSRLAQFEPGYLYGVLLGVVFSHPQTDTDDGRQAAVGALVTLLVAVGAWLALGWLRLHVTDGSFARIASETALAAIVVAGLESVAFGMMPFRFLNGAAVRAWSRLAWAGLFGAGVFAFVHLLIGPQSGYLAELSPSGLVAALAVFAAFALISFATWGYFRFRPDRG
jgi:hypothetical protein